MASGTVKKLSNVSFYTKKFSKTYDLTAATISSDSVVTPKSTLITFSIGQTGWSPIGVISFESGGGIHPCSKVSLSGEQVEMIIVNFKNQAYTDRTASIVVLYQQDA